MENAAGYSKVLIVEDDPVLRLVTVEALESYGIPTLNVSDASEALEAVSKNPDILTILTDINMPGPLDGVDLALSIRDTRPHISMIITSGDTNFHDPRKLPRKMCFMPKPYSMADIVGKIRELQKIA